MKNDTALRLKASFCARLFAALPLVALIGAIFSASPATAQTVGRTIAGSVTVSTATGQFVGVPNVTVTAFLSNALAIDSAKTDAAGNYKLRAAIGDQIPIVVKAAREGWKFFPDSAAAVFAAATDTTRSISFVARTYSLSGYVHLKATAANATILPAGVTLKLWNDAGALASTANVTELVRLSGDGGILARFVFAGVSSGTYALKGETVSTFPAIYPPTRFDPTSTSVTISVRNVADARIVVTPVLPTLTGRIVAETGAPFNAIPITATFTPTTAATISYTLTAQTNDKGYYSFSFSTEGTCYAAQPAITGYAITFSPPGGVNRDIKFGTNPASLDFTATALRYTVSGNIVIDDEGTGVAPSSPPALTIIRTRADAVSSVPDTLKVPLVKTSTGYSYSEQLPAGAYTFKFELKDYKFANSAAPVFTTSVAVSANVGLPDYRAIPIRYTISGVITATMQRAGVPTDTFAEGVIVDAKREGTEYIVRDTTNAQGEYGFSLPQGIYVVTARNKEKLYTINNDPVLGTTSIRVNLSGKDTTINFTALDARPFYAVSGIAAYRNGRRIPGVAITIVENGKYTFVPQKTQQDGSYGFQAFSGSVYTITPSFEAHVFEPKTKTFAEIQAPATQGFQATLDTITITGVTHLIKGAPLRAADALVSAEGAAFARQNVALDTLGRYTIRVTGAVPGDEITLAPLAKGYKFGPPARLQLVTTATSDVSAVINGKLVIRRQDFRALETTAGIRLATVSGRVMLSVPGGALRPLEGAIVSDGTRAAATDTAGVYTLRDAPNGVYTLKVVKQGYTITSLTVTIQNTTSLENRNFTAFVANPFNQAPVIGRLAGGGTLNAPAGRATLFSASSVQPFFSDPDGDNLSYAINVEDPTILRARAGRDSLIIEGLTAGNTTLWVRAFDEQGGVTTAIYRAVITAQPDSATSLVRADAGINTNFNAPVLIPRSAFNGAVALAQTKAAYEGLILEAGCAKAGDEVGAFNEDGDCVGSVRLSNGDNILTVWSEEPQSGAKGMKAGKEPSFSINRRRNRAALIYILTIPPPWPFDRGDVKTLDCETAVSAEQTATEYALSASPNPASGAFVVEYALPAAGEVSLELWDMMGRRAALLASGERSAGRHKISFDASALPPGVYLCRFVSGAASLAARVVVAR